jgi:uncharacterized Zn-finger protein
MNEINTKHNFHFGNHLETNFTFDTTKPTATSTPNPIQQHQLQSYQNNLTHQHYLIQLQQQQPSHLTIQQQQSHQFNNQHLILQQQQQQQQQFSTGNKNNNSDNEDTANNSVNSNGELRPYKCSQCFKTFRKKVHMMQHCRIHSGEKPYSCEYCEKRFTQLSHLWQHRRRHTGDRPYKCDVDSCDKSFTQLSNLQSHIKTHSSTTAGSIAAVVAAAMLPNGYSTSKDTLTTSKNGNSFINYNQHFVSVKSNYCCFFFS